MDEVKSQVVERTDLAPRNAETIRRHHAVLNTGDVVAASQFYAVDTRNHGVPVGRTGVLRVLTDILGTFPDWQMEIENLAAVGNDVTVRMIVTGTHGGVGKIPVNGGLLVGVPPTGKSFKVQHIHWYTLRQGLIVEHRANRDDIGMMQQLGLLPAVQR
jgi:predicted ester cyclase